MVIDAATGAPRADRIPDLLTTTSSTRYQVNWLTADSSAPAFLYPRLWPGSESGPLADRLARGRIFLHRIGRLQSADVPVFGYGVSPTVSFAPEDLTTRDYAAPGSRWLIGSVYRASKNGREDYVARRTAYDATVPSCMPLIALEDRATYPQLRRDTAYALLRRDADRGRIAKRVLGDGPLPSGDWETIVPERRGVIAAFSIVGDALYFTERDGGALSLYVLPPDGSAPRLVPLPLIGTVRIEPRSPAMDGVLVSVESWAIPPRWFHVSRAGTMVEALRIDDGAKMSASPTLVSDRLEAKSRDGTMVPVSLVYDRAKLRSGRLDGTAPLMVEAYGGFADARDATYDPMMQVWTALGGVCAYAHVRGGGELGHAWHRAAMRETQVRSVEDMIGTAEALIARGYSAPGRVAFQRISFGAVLAGLVPLSRPDLFGAAVYDVGGPDEVRAPALDPSAARNVAEIGDTDTPEGIRLLMAASPYHRISARLTHPAMLTTVRRTTTTSAPRFSWRSMWRACRHRMPAIALSHRCERTAGTAGSAHSLPSGRHGRPRFCSGSLAVSAISRPSYVGEGVLRLAMAFSEAGFSRAGRS
ncbi:prolyl oligopeptidase family serine peptidase [Gemmatimonas sp.]|uniref:prolyl oligopeptidase family serine peptidase n=1 Tax=Gemmatimonas sp. TaxID=1962908 RepID=UPI003565D8D3